jgi:phosphatidylglycerol lysyltransferase
MSIEDLEDGDLADGGTRNGTGGETEKPFAGVRETGPGSRPVGPIVHLFVTVLSACLFGLALWVLYRELGHYRYHLIVHYFHSLRGSRIAGAVFFSLASYLCLTGYDLIALRTVDGRAGYRKIVFSSLKGYALSRTLGTGPAGGDPIRYRVYSGWGISAVEAAGMVFLCTITAGLGFLFTGGISFTLAPAAVHPGLRLPSTAVLVLGIVLLTAAAGYPGLTAVRKRPIRLQGIQLRLPSFNQSIAQLFLAAAEWVFSALAFYILFPSRIDLSFTAFLGMFAIAQAAGIASRVPGGIGVFEMFMALLLPGWISHSDMIATFISFRIFYYFLPLTLAIIPVDFSGMFQKRERVLRFARVVSRRVGTLTPHVLALVVFVAGAFLLISGSLPIMHGRLSFLMNIFPLHVIEVSHFLGSITGVGLILLARALQRRINAAYFMVMGLLFAGIVLSLLRGIKYEEAAFLSVVFLALIPARRDFYRVASILEQRFTAGWITAVILVLAASVWLGLFAYRHVEYSQNLWWQFSLKGDAPRFLRASVGVFAVVLIFAAGRLFRPSAAKPAFPIDDELEKAAGILESSLSADALLALLGDKALIFNGSGNAFLMYGVQGRSWISFGDPVGPEEEWEELLWRFRDLSDRYHGWLVFYEVGNKHLDVYRSFGLAHFKFGEEGRVPLEPFTMEGASRKKLRHLRNLLQKEGWKVEILPRELVPGVLPDLKRVSDEWLARKGHREMGFSLGYFSERYLARFPAALVRKNGRIEAFANMLAGGREELSVDLMRFGANAPEGIMEFLFTELILWGREKGYRFFNLGMVPLAGLEDDPAASIWNRFGTFIFKYGENFYNFQGLRAFKNKFDPVWEPRYLVVPNGFVMPKILIDVSMLISRGRKTQFLEK